MRTIDTDGLRSLGSGRRGPWPLEDGLLLRTTGFGAPLRTEAQARATFDIYRAARTAGAPTPDALEIVQVEGGYGVVVEFVTGVGLHVHLVIGSYSAEEAGQAMGELARKLHAFHVRAGRDWNAEFARRVRELAELMPPNTGSRLVSLVDEIPASDTLLHGDLHFANVVVCDGEYHLIDMEWSGFGNPVFDLAITRSSLMTTTRKTSAFMGIDQEQRDKTAHAAWDAFMRSYFEGAGVSLLADLDRRIAVLSEVDSCCNIHGPFGAHRESLNSYQRERIAACVRKLEELLPQVEDLSIPS